MNFNNLEVNDTYLHSRASKAVQFSKEAEFMGQNFMQVTNERNQKEKQDIRYKAKHLKSNDEYEREQKFYESKKEALIAEFQILDRDHNGIIDKEEVLNYLINNGLEEEEAIQLREEIFVTIDQNHDGSLSLEEFSTGYIEIIKKLRYRQIECEDKMLESYE